MRGVRKPSRWRVCVSAWMLYLAVAAPHYSGNWFFKLHVTQSCVSIAELSFYSHIPESGTTSQLLNENSQPIIEGLLIVAKNGLIAGSIKSGARSTYDIAFTGTLSDGQGLGSWFDAYGCRGLWSAAQERKE